jgi:hypothetical protein
LALELNVTITYYPKSEWAKFCKISIFLLTVKDYIDKQCEQADITTNRGYYHDLRDAMENGSIEVSGIATTNYTGLITDVLEKADVNYLNGSTRIWYDPYLNTIGERGALEEKDKHFIVPLLFTQSGTKPMTSIDMSMKYVDTYKAFLVADCICSVGFGFNADDEHINGIVRKLVNEGKKLVIVQPIGHRQINDLQREITDKLKLNNSRNVIILDAERGTRLNNGKLWINALSKLKI